MLALRAAGAPRARLARSLGWLRRGAEPRRRLGGRARLAQHRRRHRRRDAGDRADTEAAHTGDLATCATRPAAERRLPRSAASGAVNSQSTAWAVQGMLAVGADPGAVREGGDGALDYLAARQDADGHYRYSTPATRRRSG